MGYGPEAVAEMRKLENQSRQRRRDYERRLEKLGFSQESIQDMDEPALIEVIERIDNTIRGYEQGQRDVRAAAEKSFGSADLKLTLSSSSREFLATLLDRKELALERLRQIRTLQQVAELNQIADTISDPATRRSIEGAIEALRSQTDELTKKLEEVSQARSRSEAETEALAIDRYERKARVWQSFMQRESVASIMGAVILLALTTTLIVAAFIESPIPDLLNNAFLIVIGYFFGQATGRPE